MTDTQYITVPQLAKMFGVPVGTVYWWNRMGTAPKRIKIGRGVRYRLSDVEKWAKSREI